MPCQATDKGYVSAEREAAFTGPGKAWGVMRKAPKGGKLHPLDERANRIIAMVRARVEHAFRVIKRQFGHVKTRYRGLSKKSTLNNAVRLPTADTGRSGEVCRPL